MDPTCHSLRRRSSSSQFVPVSPSAFLRGIVARRSKPLGERGIRARLRNWESLRASISCLQFHADSVNQRRRRAGESFGVKDTCRPGRILRAPFRSFATRLKLKSFCSHSSIRFEKSLIFILNKTGLRLNSLKRRYALLEKPPWLDKLKVTVSLSYVLRTSSCQLQRTIQPM